MESIEARVRRLCSEAGLSFSGLSPLAGDVGQRRYFRGRAGSGTVIAALYPEGQEEAGRRWARVRDALSPSVRVPMLLAAEPGGALHLIEDLGDRPLSSVWSDSPGRRGERHARAAAVAAAIAAVPDPGANPPFSADFFFTEMEKSRESFFTSFAREPLAAGERSVHDEFARALASEIAGHPRTFVHRDFHLDNLLEVGGGIGVIDFQDARPGPDSYDLASLTGERAALVSPDPAAAAAAVEAFASAARPREGFEGRLRRVALQRGWKAAGTFAKVCSEGRGGVYGRFLAPQIAAVLRNLGKTGVEAEFAAILARRSAKLFRQEESPC
ncbi:MAG TPA: phosphotransferase [Thermoanaerobaculia bacterium]|nr:phosphotransferase [Thermoanaerobaculia bacterium]